MELKEKDKENAKVAIKNQLIKMNNSIDICFALLYNEPLVVHLA
ncbi:hypothetical protein LCGC14_0729690 [marine sediment metagenome]|uniref:Uncharacterized protein n=1 Tax=marine sediment metagenome TaxID=412755 RepID=A0A0F9QV33_9ZZZZ